MTAVGFAPLAQKSSRKVTESLREDRIPFRNRTKVDGSAMNSGSTLATVRSYDWLRGGLEEKPVPKRQTRRTMPFASKGVDECFERV